MAGRDVRGTQCAGCQHSYPADRLRDGCCSSCTESPTVVPDDPTLPKDQAPPSPRPALRSVPAWLAIESTASTRARRARTAQGGEAGL